MDSTLDESLIRVGVLTAIIEAEFPEKIEFSAQEHEWFVDEKDGKLKLKLIHKNSYVRLGLRNSLLLEFGLGGTAVGYIGVSSDTSAVTYNQQYLNGSSAGSASNTIILPFSPAASIVTDGSNVVEVVTAGATFTNSSFTSSVFTINKVGLLNTSTDAGTGLIDVVGGSGSTPYSRSFTLGLGSAGTFTFLLQIAVTAPVATSG